MFTDNVQNSFVRFRTNIITMSEKRLFMKNKIEWGGSRKGMWGLGGGNVKGRGRKEFRVDRGGRGGG